MNLSFFCKEMSEFNAVSIHRSKIVENKPILTFI